MNCEAIIFDFGGILLPIDYQAVARSFDALMPGGNTRIYSQQKQLPVFDALERGETSAAEFLAALKEIFPDAAEQQLQDAWNSILGTMPAERLALLEKVRKNYRIFLLSNTNVIHAAHFEQDFKERFGQLPEAWFDGVYYSYECGFRKPEKAIFDLVMLENNLDARRTVFFEDTIANVEGALQAGIPTVFVNIPEGQHTEDYFDAGTGLLHNEKLRAHLRMPSFS